jgi:hypothetical protein
MSLPRSFLAIVAAALLGVSSATPGLAYGAENWQIGFAGTGTVAGTGNGFGFWGWCALGGGVTSGNTGDCQFAQYVHTPSGSGFTCHESLAITSWTVGVNGDFFASGTVTVTPTNLTAPCLAIFPGTPTTSFTGMDLGIPAKAGHYNLGALIPGEPGEFQIQVTQI